MVVSGLSAPQPVISVIPTTTASVSVTTEENFEDHDVIDPTNPKIITTAAERKILSIVKDMLCGIVNEEDIVGKDTESYYSVLYQNKTNRWIVRYVGDKRKTQVYFPIELTEQHKEVLIKCGLEFGSGGGIVLDKPESIMRLSVVIFDALAYCRDDNNFKRERTTKMEVPEPQE